MAAYLQTITTGVPEYAYSQQELREKMKELVATSQRDKKILHRIYTSSGIETRHSVLQDFSDTGRQTLFYNGQGSSPGTGARNRIFREKGRELFVDTARRSLGENRIDPEAVTHLITISCTGFYAPGPDYDIIRELGLDPRTERYHLGFMGCYAAIPGLKLASRICAGNEKATVLVVASELCTLHFQHATGTDDMIAASVFADGAAATVVTSVRPSGGNCLEIVDFASIITGEGAEDMAWTIGDTGFRMVLSTYVPEILTKNLDRFLHPLMQQYRLEREQVGYWAVHPGGRAILDRIEKQLNLEPDILRYSRRVLSGYGNMSSVTVLFVLREILLEPEPAGSASNVLSMAFGPGLTIESSLMIKHSDT